MLVPFVIDSSGFVPDPAWSPATQRNCYKGLLDVWQRIGLLAHDGDSLPNSRLWQAVSRLPISVRSLWLEALKQSPLIALPDWNGRVSQAELSYFSTVANLAFVDDTLAEVEFRFTEEVDELGVESGNANISVCRICAAPHVRAFKEAIDLTGTHIEKNDTYQSTWDLRFKWLAAAPITHVTIVDRYAVRQLLENETQASLSGLHRFLRQLDKDATGKRYVTIYATWPKDRSISLSSIEKELGLVFERLPKKNIKEIKIYMVPNSGGFRDDGHDRFVRFGQYVWDIGCGLEIFEGAYSTKKSQASFKTGLAIDSYKAAEQDLRQNLEAKTVVIK